MKRMKTKEGPIIKDPKKLLFNLKNTFKRRIITTHLQTNHLLHIALLARSGHQMGVKIISRKIFKKKKTNQWPTFGVMVLAPMVTNLLVENNQAPNLTWGQLFNKMYNFRGEMLQGMV